MSLNTILDLVLPVRDENSRCKLPCPAQTVPGGGLIPQTGQLLSGLIYTQEQSCSCDSLVLQAAVSPASQGQKVLVVVGGERWARLPPSWHLMPAADPGVMERISFLYPNSMRELVQFTNEAPADSLPDTVIVAGMEEIIEKSEIGDNKCDRKFGQSFAKFAAILHDFSLHCAERNDQNYSKLVAFVRFNPRQEKFLSTKLKFWFPEVWELFHSTIVCKTSPREMTVKFFLKDDQYYLESVTAK
eukprot:GFUD01026967.1.p1 GENE.GFUD01026967.1~~GFUD01026967.1.p1  ORF type:complete len:244 (-),score=101.96 GFUD01026967.1:55-786(-)